MKIGNYLSFISQTDMEHACYTWSTQASQGGVEADQMDRCHSQHLESKRENYAHD